MILTIQPGTLKGTAKVPPSKSHTIRALALAALAGGDSEILSPLDSADGRSAREAARALGAEIEVGTSWKVRGTGGSLKPPDGVIDVGNSGTTARIFTAVSALLDGSFAVLTGDEQSRRRPMNPLVEALNRLGGRAFSTRGNGCLPVVSGGRLRGGAAAVSGVTSQFVTALLIAAPLGVGDSRINVIHLQEAPYVDMTLWWLERLGIRYEREGYREFYVYGGQSYPPFCREIPADFSSATFLLCAAAMTDSDVLLTGLDLSDPQGDKKVIDMLGAMGARIESGPEGIRVRGGDLRGMDLDLNDTPDALPALAVVGCRARGRTRLLNVPQARLKETDRIAVMAGELLRMGARVRELPDGLAVEESPLKGTQVDGHADHRVVMSLAIAGLAAGGATSIRTAEAMHVTFPAFPELLASLGARLRLE